ncbi:hypothetical protein [Thermococcus sp.]|uniref:hypothetical protein n=1 Tax=Thermococcus sp. TaxID=35749 RepID=UPI002609CC98|nr:hypothetical protein [Thermococcus sp.]
MTKRDVLRKLLLILTATINSEILSTSQNFGTLFSNPLLLAIYFFSFAMMDELVQRYNLGNKAIFYMGAIFGLILEGFVAFTLVADPLAPFVMIPFSIFWHGLITTWVSFTVVDVVIPRREKGINRIWMILGVIFWVILLVITIGSNISIVISHLFVYMIIITLILILLFLVRKDLESPVRYRPKINLSIFLIGLGFIIGQSIHGKHFSSLDYSLMLIFYIAIVVLLVRRKGNLQPSYQI